MPSELHKKMSEIARAENTSLNNVCISLLKNGLKVKGENEGLLDSLQAVTKTLKGHFKGELLGIALFGSRARGDASASSDLDLLIVLDKNVELVRSLYAWWDSEISWNGVEELNPHFIHYPEDLFNASGLWFEVAFDGKILYQADAALDQLFYDLQKLVKDGTIRRYFSNGHPYWVRRQEK
jgi:predicted nucleotidyltransferase